MFGKTFDSSTGHGMCVFPAHCGTSSVPALSPTVTNKRAPTGVQNASWRWITGLNLKPKTVTFLEENRRKIFVTFV